mmetsp:Transcript_2727/g.8085  ORF Transcript_2727/g.8085 Transcript_2727/m.8085 type:complete len:121 (-) Transcript_2727:23-385(-)
MQHARPGVNGAAVKPADLASDDASREGEGASREASESGSLLEPEPLARAEPPVRENAFTESDLERKDFRESLPVWMRRALKERTRSVAETPHDAGDQATEMRRPRTQPVRSGAAPWAMNG